MNDDISVMISSWPIVGIAASSRWAPIRNGAHCCQSRGSHRAHSRMNRHIHGCLELGDCREHTRGKAFHHVAAILHNETAFTFLRRRMEAQEARYFAHDILRGLASLANHAKHPINQALDHIHARLEELLWPAIGKVDNAIPQQLGIVNLSIRTKIIAE